MRCGIDLSVSFVVNNVIQLNREFAVFSPVVVVDNRDFDDLVVFTGFELDLFVELDEILHVNCGTFFSANTDSGVASLFVHDLDANFFTGF